MLLQVIEKSGVVAVNKCDLESKVEDGNLIPHAGGKRILRMSAKTGEGISEAGTSLGRPCCRGNYRRHAKPGDG